MFGKLIERAKRNQFAIAIVLAIIAGLAVGELIVRFRS